MGPDIFDRMAVTVPEGTYGDLEVMRFEIPKADLENLRLAFDGRGAQPGTYTKLIDHRRKILWMSDTTAERRDHLWPALEIEQHGGRVLLGGLGLGMILNVALLAERVTHVDVVEINPDVIELIGPHYEKMAAENGKTLVFHEADVLKMRWPPNTRWNVAWFDIWENINSQAYPEMVHLRRSYGRRTDYCDCWSRLWIKRNM